MKANRQLIKYTGLIALGVLALTAVMFIIYAALGRFSASVLAGGLYTGVVAVANYFVMGLTLMRVTDRVGERARSDEEIERLSAQMSARVKGVTTLRQLGMLVLVVIGLAVFRFEPLPTILPIAFPGLTALALQFIERASSKGSESH